MTTDEKNTVLRGFMVLSTFFIVGFTVGFYVCEMCHNVK